MSKRSHASDPNLRPGCLPAVDWPNPQHNFASNRDGLLVRLIAPDQYTSILTITHARTGDTAWRRHETLYELTTSNGWRCYADDWQIAGSLLHLAGEGHYGLQYWMRGYPYDEARTCAQQAYEKSMRIADERKRQGQGQPRASHADGQSPPPIDIGPDDISYGMD